MSNKLEELREAMEKAEEVYHKAGQAWDEAHEARRKAYQAYDEAVDLQDRHSKSK